MRRSQTKPGASPTDDDDRLSARGRGSTGGGAPSNPLLALQTLLAGDAVPAKQRARAAQQLGEYFGALPTTASLYATYEPYLVLFTELMVAAGKGARELRAGVLGMLQALAGHNPRRFSEWITQNIQHRHEAWLIEWSCGLLREAEKRLPKVEPAPGPQSELWNEKTVEYLEFDAAVARVVQMWRTFLDHAVDEGVVRSIIRGFALFTSPGEGFAPGGQWQALGMRKIQVHFVDIADVLIGWAINTPTDSDLREKIVVLLQGMDQLWMDNSVFSLQLLSSFAEEIAGLAAGASEREGDDSARMSTLLVCFLMVAQSAPEIALARSELAVSPLERVLEAAVFSCTNDEYSDFCVVKCAEYLSALSASSPTAFSALAMRAIRFLVLRTALLEGRHDTALETIATVINSVSSVITSHLPTLLHQPGSRTEVVAILEADTSATGERNAARKKSATALERLFRLQQQFGLKTWTRLLVKLLRIGGLAAMKTVALSSLQRQSERRLSESGSAYVTHCATCFVLASSDFRRQFRHQPGVEDVAQAQEIAKIFAVHFADACSRQVAPRHLQLLVKMYYSLLRTVRMVASDFWADPALQAAMSTVLDTATVLLLNSVTAASELVEDVVKLTCEAVRQIPTASTVSRDTSAKLFSAISTLASSHDAAVRELGVSILKELAISARGAVSTDELTTKTLEFVVDPRLEIREEAVWGVLGRVASDALTSRDIQRASVGLSGRHRRQLPFAVADFEDVFQLLEHPASEERDWLALGSRLSDRREVMKPEESAPTRESVPQLLCNVVRQAAGWCVENRLRTHFGGPAQTFASIERLLLSYAAPKVNPQSLSGRSQLENDGLLSMGSAFPSNAWRGLGKWMTLEFVSALELLIGHACASINDGLDPDSEAYKAWLFYRANKAVCDDWLHRIRPLLAELSSGASSLELNRLHLYAIASAACSKLRRLLHTSSSAQGASDKLISELRAAEGDLDAALFALCRCCCDLKDADSIVGFQKWGRVIAAELARRRSTVNEQTYWNDGSQPLLFGWMTAMRHEACMHYEDAVEAYEELLRPILSAERSTSGTQQASVLDLFEAPDVHLRMSLATVLGCFRQCAQCYVVLRRWRRLRDLTGAFISTAAYVAESAKPFPGVQSIVDCAQVWTQELELVSLLETESENGDASAFQGKLAFIGDDCKSSPVPQLMQRWGFASDWARAPAEDLRSSGQGDVCGDVLDRLRQVSLQSGSHTAQATRIIEKKIERLFLDISQASFGKLRAKGGVGDAERTSWSEFPSFSVLDSSIHDSSLWSGYTQRLRALTRLDHGQVSLNEIQWAIYLTNAARLARKQRNFEMAGRMLTDAEDLAKRVSLVTPVDISYERARLLAATGAEADGVRLLARVCAFKLSSFEEVHSEDTKGSIIKALGRLAASLNNMAATSPEEVSSLSPMLVPIFNFRTGPTDSSSGEIKVELSGAAVEKCLYVATQISPTSPKAWFRYSNWCYELGKREVEQVVEQNGYIHLSPYEELEISAAFNELNVASADRDAIVRGFCHIFENGAIVPQRSDKFRLLCYERMREDADEETINNLVALQASSHARVLRYHLLAADSYGSYLQIQGEHHDSTASGAQQQKVMLVALRLLHLLTKYGSERDVVASIERTFTVGPVAPWALVVPQLIARAGHPDLTVSSIVCLLLQRLARLYPHLLVYPAVVDSAGTKVDSDALERSANGSSLSRLAGILNEVRGVSSGLVDGVSLLVSELRRVSILWDEAWITALAKLSTDVARRTSTLEKESARVAKNTSLSPDEKRELAERKFVAIMKPVLLSLERVWGATCGNAGRFGPLTPHEQHFLREYGGAIERVLSDLREACTVGRMVDPANFSPQRVQAIWEPLEAISKSLMSAAGRRDRVSLQDISPAILSIADVFAHTNMPGIARGPGRTDHSKPMQKMVYIHKLLPSVSVLKTKTKPKLLQFIGSDGVTHRYLLKAKEDLRLDERVMQFLAAVNELLRADKAASVRGLNAQNYSVIPISNDAGLIQMVPDVVPFFQIYTAHQEHATGGRNPQMSPPPTAAGRGGGAPPNLPQPPTVQFYAMLKQHGIHDVSQRSKWPLSVLRQIYADFVRQLPRNMIKQELLLRSDDLRESWAKNARLVKSLAVMSVLGYVVGLGDRHLDNILLCVNTGEVVHIDYNVCFDKGKKLKVPEVVPFRLTPMLQDALGLTGTEGPFRVAFETTLRVVRSENSREALLTLLEAFVYSPLTEWIAEDSRRAGKTVDLKARLEVNVNLSLFLSRAEERRQDTTAFGAEFSACVRELQSTLQVAKAQLRPLLDEQRELHSILEKSAAVTMALSHLEPQVRDGASSLVAKQSEVQAKRQLMDEVVAKLDVFSSECLERHRQICAWRERAAAFRSIALDRHRKCFAGADAASFQDVYAMICGLRDTDGTFGGTKELAADGLEALCVAVDTSVARFRLGVQDVALSLLPSLMAYGQTRHELDEFLLSQYGSTNEDIYSSWRTQTLKMLQAAQNGSVADVAGFNIDVSSQSAKTGTPSLASVAESSNALSQLEHIQARFGFDSSEYGRAVLNDLGLPSEEEAGRVVEEIGSLVTAMKVSNAQSQRIMKLASASWIVGAMEGYGENQDRQSGSRRLSDDALAQYSLFRRVLVHAKTCAMLLEFVSTSKGTVKRLRAADLIGGRVATDKHHNNSGVIAALTGVIQLLAAVEQFAVCAQEKLMLMELSLQTSLSPDDARLKTLLVVEEATQDGQACSDILFAEGDSPWQATLGEWPALRDVITAVAAVVNHWVEWRKTLQVLMINEFSDAEETYAMSKYWLQLVVGVYKSTMAHNQPSGSRLEGESSVSELLSSSIEGFLYDHVAVVFHHILSTIVTREWKIPFAPHRGDNGAQPQLPLRDQWAMFMADHVRECLPLSAMGAEVAGCASTSSGDSSVHQLAAKVMQFADLASAFWVRDWVAQQRDQRAARLAAIRKLHVGRLRYAAWLSQEAVGGLHRAPSRLELLASLSAQVPRLNALSVELQRLEASVLELAQQLEYVASQLSVLSNNGSAVSEGDGSWSRTSQDASVSLSLHEHIQDCYTKISALFSYTRELCDLVQGISVVETSIRDALPALGGGVELQVDTLGKNLVASARVAALSWRKAQQELVDVEENVARLQQELDQKTVERDELVAAESICRESMLQLCAASKVNILDTTKSMRTGGERLLAMLTAFDKPRNASRHPIPGNHRDGAVPSVAASSPCLSTSSSQSNADTISSNANADVIKQSRPEPSPSWGAGNRSHDAAGGMTPSGYSFIENERLAKILLRSIRAVTHIDTLEGVLEKHEHCFAALRGVIGRLELVTREFVGKTERVLSQIPFERVGVGSEHSAALRSSFLAITTGSTATPSSAVADADVDAELLEMVDALIEYMEALGELPTVREASEMSTGDAGVTTGGGASMLEMGQQLVAQSLRLFFEVTEMADRLSSMRHSQPTEQVRPQGLEYKQQDTGERSDVEEVEDNSSAGPTASASGTRIPSASGESVADADSALGQLDEQSESQASVAVSATSNITAAAADVVTTQARSRYGLQVLSRIEEKLSGICPDADARGAVLTVEQQASWLIEEATKVDNLCVMYEGWTPWI